METKGNYHFSRVFAAACIGMLIFGIVMLTLGSTLPDIMEKYTLDDLSAGTLASLLPTGILIGSLIFGPIVDRFSYRYLLVFSTLLIAFSMYGIAIAGGLLVLQLSFLVIGFGGGLINGGTNALVADISRDRAKAGSANLSLLGVFFGVGALTVPSLMALLAQLWTYEQILISTAICMALPLIYFFGIRYPLAKQTQHVSIGKSITLFKDRSLLIVAFMLFFQSAFEGIFNNWTTTFLQRIRLFSESDALAALSIYVIGLTITRILLAGLLRLGNERLILIGSVLALFSGALILMFFGEHILVYTGAACLGVGTAAIFPVLLSFVSELYQEMRGTAFSVVIFIAVLGNILFNVMMGFLADQWGISVYPIVLLLCITMISIIYGYREFRSLH